ncbi:protein kinase domain-containing protein [Archangium lansingense]|uniref:Protein kinase n=1 Tax=Archangium lansingense TaxID=2995310 RepID=A0ABT4A9R8_9BACT|nr:protein kinase [Archangium lansinium]MCY1078355.1 protein kinase [Archangium lansinium]
MSRDPGWEGPPSCPAPSQGTEESELSSFERELLQEVILADSPPRLPIPGEWLGGREGRRFKVRTELGHGGMGWVFRARDEELQREVALKFLVPRWGLTDEALREARAIAQLSHEHIVRIFDVSEWIDRPGATRLPFLVMECLEGESLAAVLKREGPLEPKRALEILDAILAGLAHAHEHQVIHRDLKPSNVFVTRQGTVKLLDFGLAWFTAAATPHARYLPTAGTPGYMAPEQWRGEAQDARTDLWAAGMVLYEMLTGRLPYPVFPLEELQARITSAEPIPSVRAMRPELRREVDALLSMALAKEPEQRFPTAREMREELHEVQVRLGFRQETSRGPQRRQVTLVCCQLTRRNGSLEQLDPEELGELQTAFHQACKELLPRHGGSLLLSMGGEVLACFGCLRAREDDSERAVRTALSLARLLPEVLREKLPHLPERVLAVRLGVRTDRVVLEEHSIQGEAPGVAAWLARQVGPGGVAMGDTTRRLVRGVFETEPLGARTFEGLSGSMSLEVHRVRREREVASRFDRSLAAKGSLPLVGRERERQRLVELWEEARSGHGSFVLVSGEAGIGKSLLLQALRERVAAEATVPIPLQCWPRFSAGSLQPPSAVLQQLFQFSPEGTPPQHLRELVERLGALGLSEEQAHLIGLFISLPVPADSPVHVLTPEWRRERVIEALVEMLRRMARERPLLFTVEDLQWADSLRLELLGSLLGAVDKERILVALSARPDFQPPWPARPWFHPLALERLPAESSAALVKEVALGRELPSELLQELVRKTDGVPLFIEEMTRMVLEQADSRSAQPGELPSSIPETLHELLLARLDLLPSRQKALAQLCAVVGWDLSLALLVKLTGRGEAELRWVIARLENAGLLQEWQGAGGPVFLFRHVLIQEAALQSLSRRERRRYHQHIAQVLEGHFPEVAETRPEVLAHHHAEAGAPEHAIPYWARAGQSASMKADYPESVRYLSLALKVLRGQPESGQRNQQELQLLMGLGLPLMQTRGLRAPEVQQADDRVRQLIREQGESVQVSELAYWEPFISYARADFHLRHKLARHLVGLGRSQHRPALLALGHRMMATDFLIWGRMRLARKHIERSVACVDSEVEQELPIAARYGLSPTVGARSVASIIFSALGELEEARRYSREAREHAERIGHPHTLAYALTYSGVTCQIRGEVQDALELATRAQELSRRYDFWIFFSLSAVTRGWALCMLGQEQEGLVLLRKAIDGWRSMGLRAGMPYNFILLAEVELKRGQVRKGMSAILEALAWEETTGELSYGVELHRLYGELLRAWGREDDARYSLQRAIWLARRQGSGLFELRAALSLGRLLRDVGRPQAAWRLLEKICERLEADRHDSPDFQAARALREQLAP